MLSASRSEGPRFKLLRTYFEVMSKFDRIKDLFRLVFTKRIIMQVEEYKS